MPSRVAPEDETGSPILNIWDSEYCPPSEAFSVFREAICGTFMPWAPEFESEREFEGRIKGAMFEDGSVGHVSISPLVAVRESTHLAGSAVDGFYANFVLSGELNVEQAGRSGHAAPGDLVIYDTSQPVRMTSRSAERYEDISFLIPKRCYAHLTNAEDQLSNTVLQSERIIEPLDRSLRFLANNIQTMSALELVSLYDSCVSLIPLATGFHEDHMIMEPTVARAAGLWQEMLDYVNRNLAEPNLSPALAARHFDISARYVHKLFADRGTTFGAVVLSKRLANIRDDLISPGSRERPISELAYRWGFKDLSSFNRAFRNRFDCTPKQLRAMAA